MFPSSILMLTLLLIAAGATLYYGAILSGLLKDPLMARLRRYGEEYPLSVLTNMLIAAGVCALLIGTQIPVFAQPGSYIRRTFPSWLFFLLGLLLLGAAAFVHRRPALRDALPRWHWELLQCCTRQERRHIAYAWLRIPRLLRWRLNGDQKSFQVWSELVRLTVIYGAFDPTSPWNRWT